MNLEFWFNVQIQNTTLESMGWLAHHPKLLSIGVYGPGVDLYQRLYRGDDAMAALGALYGHLLAAVYPFLGGNPCLRVLLSGRSEKSTTPGVARTGVQSAASGRLPSGQTGGDRINIGFTQDSFWQTVSALQPDICLPNGVSQRNQTLAVYSHPSKFEAQLRSEGTQLPDTQWLKNLADLACGMMAALSPDNRGKKIRFALGQRPGSNMRFFTIQDLLA